MTTGEHSAWPVWAKETVAARLSGESRHYVPSELDSHDWRRFFVKVENDRRRCHLHLMRELAERFRDDREACTRAKSRFIQEVLENGQA
ncbi:hypothetical protein QWJ34_22245 [Saccharibacillus sp. CPCC 101409]|uniref:hypothetical protein n=1 Tax=Saccharibacillus sp. CPCC 101409 TaxID=3058041 RepID=UPI0026729639|nr:hypothetical protein [Saccharibacillus sp. CPCC 101409]MDO3412502.1 hypothetical protein [Saccharibacillus sp. CPCC 101409]